MGKGLEKGHRARQERAAATTEGTARTDLAAGIFVAISVLLMLPLALPGNPPLLDYHNHLARLSVAFDPDAFKQAYYDFRWVPVGNLGLEAVVALLSRLVSVETAAQMAVALTVGANCLGLAALSLAIHGRITTAAIFGLVFVWGGTLQYGFLSYSLGTGLALLLAAVWIAGEERPLGRRVAIGAVGCLVLYFTHSLAFFGYGLMIFGYMFGRLFWAQDETFARRLASAVVAGLQSVPTLAVAALTQTSDTVREVTFSDLADKIASLNLLLFRPAGEVTIGVLGLWALLFLISSVRHVVPIPARMIGPVATLFAAVAFLPDSIESDLSTAANLDWRFLLPLALTASASLREPFGAGRQALAQVLSGLVPIAASGLMVVQHWLPWIGDEKALRNCLAKIERGALVAPVFQPWNSRRYLAIVEPPGLLHVGAWSVTDRSAFYPSLFAFEGQQPLRYRDHLELREEGKRLPFLAEGDRAAISAYDWILVIYAERVPEISDTLLPLIEPAVCESTFFSLHPVNKRSMPTGD